MDINTSYVSGYDLGALAQSSIERLSTSQAINSTSDDPAGLLISDSLSSEKNSVSQSIENINSGIAMSNIAQNGIDSQKQILEDIRSKTLEAMNGTVDQEQKDQIAKDIEKQIQDFQKIANTTTYNGTQLLKINGDTSDDLSIVEGESTITMTKADTTSVSDSLKTFLSDFSTNPDSMRGMLNGVDQGIETLGSQATDFAAASNQMISTARNSISTEKELATANATIMEIDYSKEVSSFNKTNLTSQIGLMMQSQANAVQSRTINLLSQ